jgi:hypothetical protein
VAKGGPCDDGSLRRDGTARCWGNNKSGQLGNGEIWEHWLPGVTMVLATTAAVPSR